MRKSLQQLYLYRDGIGGPRSNAQWRDQRQPDCIDTTNLAHDLGIAVTNPDDIIAGHTVDIDLEVREVSRESKGRSEEHTSELQSLMRISYAVFCLKKKTENNTNKIYSPNNLTTIKQQKNTQTST